MGGTGVGLEDEMQVFPVYSFLKGVGRRGGGPGAKKVESVGLIVKFYKTFSP